MCKRQAQENISNINKNGSEILLDNNSLESTNIIQSQTPYVTQDWLHKRLQKGI